IDPGRDHHLRQGLGRGQRRIVTRRLTRPFRVNPTLRHWLLTCALRATTGMILQHGGARLEYGSSYPHELTPCDLPPSPNNVTVLRSKENVRESNRRDAVFAPRRRA